MSGHVPGQEKDPFQEMRHYSREERQQMRSYRPVKHRKRYMKYLVLFLDLLLLFFVYRCVSYSERKDKQDIASKQPQQTKYQAAVIVQDIRLRFKLIKPAGETSWEASAVLSKTNHKSFKLQHSVQLHFSGFDLSNRTVFSKKNSIAANANHRPLFVSTVSITPGNFKKCKIFELKAVFSNLMRPVILQITDDN